MKKIKLIVKKDNKEVRIYTIKYNETEGTQFILIVNSCKYEVDAYGNIIKIAEWVFINMEELLKRIERFELGIKKYGYDSDFRREIEKIVE